MASGTTTGDALLQQALSQQDIAYEDSDVLLLGEIQVPRSAPCTVKGLPASKYSIADVYFALVNPGDYRDYVRAAVAQKNRYVRLTPPEFAAVKAALLGSTGRAPESFVLSYSEAVSKFPSLPQPRKHAVAQADGTLQIKSGAVGGAAAGEFDGTSYADGDVSMEDASAVGGDRDAADSMAPDAKRRKIDLEAQALLMETFQKIAEGTLVATRRHKDSMHLGVLHTKARDVSRFVRSHGEAHQHLMGSVEALSALSSLRSHRLLMQNVKVDAYAPIVELFHAVHADMKANPQKMLVPKTQTRESGHGNAQREVGSRKYIESREKQWTADLGGADYTQQLSSIAEAGSNVQLLTGTATETTAKPSPATLAAPTAQPLTGSAASRSEVPAVKITGNEPIILVTPASTALMTIFNARDLLESLRYVSADIRRKELATAGKQKPAAVHVMHRMSDGSIRAFEVRELPTAHNAHMERRDWDRVVAIFTSGKEWELKGATPYAATPAALFTALPGFYVQYEDDKPNPTVQQWRQVRVLKIARTDAKRYIDSASMGDFWTHTEQWMRTKGLLR